MNRSDAIDLMHEYVDNKNLRKHMYAVEAAMRAYAKIYDEDEELWGVTGIIHDFDYEKYPSEEEHSVVGAKILEEKGAPAEVVHAIRSHVPNSKTPRDALMDKTLFAVDELCGFIVAVALVRPSKLIGEVKIKSIKKKLKQSGFARQVNRSHIEQGIVELGVERDEHMQTVLDAMKSISSELGL
ncbi:MAG: HDIG domain-containing protein [Candidatus Marinimicrobia bacterium]|nr:HDIG domain-containing protein [Candidatus Neomarinimicrobiota bacterium]